MNIQITYSIPNHEFDQSYADEYHFGKESENNMKQNWAVGYGVDNVKSITEEMDTEFVLKVQVAKSGIPVELRIPRMRVMKFINENGIETQFAISEQLIGRDISVKPRKNGDKYYYVYLKEGIEVGIDFAMLMDGTLVSSKDIPSELFIA